MSIARHDPITDTLFHFNYKAYLKSKGWKAKRERALQLARNKCQVCNAGKHLNVHHRTYERVGFERDDDLTVLCRDCHTLYHADGRLPTYSPPKVIAKPSREERAGWYAQIAAKRTLTNLLRGLK